MQFSFCFIFSINRATRSVATKDFVIRVVYVKCSFSVLDSDWAGCKSTRKSVSGGVVLCGGRPIFWRSKQQSSISLSSTEAEYISAAELLAELIYIKSVVTEACASIGFKCKRSKPTTEFTQPIDFFSSKTAFYIDNRGAIAIIRQTDDKSSKRTKHIDCKYHFIKYHAKNKLIHVQYVSTDEQLADVFTKALGVAKFVLNVDKLGYRITQYPCMIFYCEDRLR